MSATTGTPLSPEEIETRAKVAKAAKMTSRLAFGFGLAAFISFFPGAFSVALLLMAGFAYVVPSDEKRTKLQAVIGHATRALYVAAACVAVFGAFTGTESAVFVGVVAYFGVKIARTLYSVVTASKGGKRTAYIGTTLVYSVYGAIAVLSSEHAAVIFLAAFDFVVIFARALATSFGYASMKISDAHDNRVMPDKLGDDGNVIEGKLVKHEDVKDGNV